jgi:hypothetical protein
MYHGMDPLFEAQRRVRQRKRTAALLEAMRVYPPEELEQATADALSIIAEEMRRSEAIAEVEVLSTDEIERRFKAE